MAVEYLRVQSDLAWKVPTEGPVTLHEAPTYGVGFTTAAQVLYTRLGLPYPPEKADGQEWVLIYGGSTSVGLFALQLAKRAGYKVVTTSSPRNFDLVKEFGADEVVDYHDADKAVEAIRDVTGGKLAKCLDTISEGGSFKICLESFGTEGKRKYNMLLPINDEGKKMAEDKGIETETTLAYTLMGNVSPCLGNPWARARVLILCRHSNSCPGRPSPPFPRTESSTSSSARTRPALSASTAFDRTLSPIERADWTASWMDSS